MEGVIGNGEVHGRRRDVHATRLDGFAVAHARHRQRAVFLQNAGEAIVSVSGPSMQDNCNRSAQSGRNGR
jgi:hypothetical protein